jgi:hypothetical protein
MAMNIYLALQTSKNWLLFVFSSYEFWFLFFSPYEFWLLFFSSYGFWLLFFFSFYGFRYLAFPKSQLTSETRNPFRHLIRIV